MVYRRTAVVDVLLDSMSELYSLLAYVAVPNLLSKARSTKSCSIPYDLSCAGSVTLTATTCMQTERIRLMEDQQTSPRPPAPPARSAATTLETMCCCPVAMAGTVAPVRNPFWPRKASHAHSARSAEPHSLPLSRSLQTPPLARAGTSLKCPQAA